MNIKFLRIKGLRTSLIYQTLCVLSVFFLFQCTKDKASEVERELKLTTNTELIIANNTSKANIQLFADGSVVQNASDYDLYVNGEIVEPNQFNFTTERPAVYKLQAEYEGVKTNTIEIKARPDKEYPLISVPVIFHVGHFGQYIENGPTSSNDPNVSAVAVQTALDVLNKIFSNAANSKDPNAVDTGLKFRLATKNPDGSLMTEPGIDRHNVTEFDRGCFEFPDSTDCPDLENDKTLGPNEVGHFGIASIWDPNLYLNIWVVPEQNGESFADSSPPIYDTHPLLGNELYPVGTELEPDLNGEFPYCFIHFKSLTSTTVAHEVGHTLGLFHPFDYCDDLCPDTYSYEFNSKEACEGNLGAKTSSSVMDYVGPKDCFTYDQRERIRHVISHGLWHGNWKDSDS